MDIVFWFGIAVGAMVGIPVSIVANLWTDPVRGFLSRRRTIRLSRNKHKELSSYYFVRRVIGGDEAAKAVLAFSSNTRARLYDFDGCLCFLARPHRGPRHI